MQWDQAGEVIAAVWGWTVTGVLVLVIAAIGAAIGSTVAWVLSSLVAHQWGDGL